MSTTKSAFWNDNYTPINSNATSRRGIARRLSLKTMLKDRELIRTLLGVVAGSTATKTFKRVAHSTTELGGKRTVETQTLVNRATVAGDVTDLNAKLFAYTSRPTTYAVDKAKIQGPVWN